MNACEPEAAMIVSAVSRTAHSTVFIGIEGEFQKEVNAIL